jgi:hypothetical protein
MSKLNRSATTDGWLRARNEVSSALRRATGVLGGWGVAGLTGAALRGQNEQVAWFRLEAIRAGVSDIWMIGGEPRHPSRWHQFVSDEYGRTTGGSLEERLDQVLESVAITSRASSSPDPLPLWRKGWPACPPFRSCSSSCFARINGYGSTKWPAPRATAVLDAGLPHRSTWASCRRVV